MKKFTKFIIWSAKQNNNLADIVLNKPNISKDSIKDTQREKSLSNKVPVFTKSMNIKIWVVVTSKQIFIRGELIKLKQNFQKNKVVTGKTLFFVIGPFCTHYYICLNIGF